MYVDRLKLFVVYSAAVTTKRENASANRDRCVVDPSRTTVRVNRPIHIVWYRGANWNRRQATGWVRTDWRTRGTGDTNTQLLSLWTPTQLFNKNFFLKTQVPSNPVASENGSTRLQELYGTLYLRHAKIGTSAGYIYTGTTYTISPSFQGTSVQLQQSIYEVIYLPSTRVRDASSK